MDKKQKIENLEAMEAELLVIQAELYSASETEDLLDRTKKLLEKIMEKQMAISNSETETPFGCDEPFIRLRLTCLTDPYNRILGDFDSIKTMNDINSKLMSKDEIKNSLSAAEMAKIIVTIPSLYNKAVGEDGDCYKSYVGEQIAKKYQIKYVGFTKNNLDNAIKELAEISDEESNLIKGVVFFDEKQRENAEKLVLVVYAAAKAVYLQLPEAFRTIDPSYLKAGLRKISPEELSQAFSILEGMRELSVEWETLNSLVEQQNILNKLFPDIEKLMLLYDKKEALLQQRPLDQRCSDEIYTALTGLVKEIDRIETIKAAFRQKNREEAYEEAEAEANNFRLALLEFGKSFVAKNFDVYDILPECKATFMKVQSYNDKIPSILTSFEVLRKSLVSMQLIKNTRELYESYLSRAKFRFSINAPTQEDLKILEELIEAYQKVQTFFAENPKIQDQTLFATKDLGEMIQELKDQKKEAQAFKAVRERWNDRIVTDAGGRKILEAVDVITQSLEAGETLLDASESVLTPIAAEGAGDAGNRTSPDDVTQGALGDCYFLASVSAIATQPNFFYKKDNTGVIQVVEKSDGSVDYFLVKMYLPLIGDAPDERSEVWVKVLPTFIKKGKGLKYAREGDLGGLLKILGTGGELWVAILETAFAQIKESYENTNLGRPEEAFALLMNKTSKDLKTLDLSIAKSIEALDESTDDNDRKLQNYIAEVLQKGKITIHSKSENDLLAVAGAKSQDNGNIFYSEALILVPRHAYTVLSIEGAVLKMRNPHGKEASSVEFLHIEVAELKKYFADMLFVH